MATIPAPAHGLSLANITAEARHVDWREAAGDCLEGYELKLPAPTYGDWAEYSSAPATVQRIAKKSPDKALSDHHADQFQQTDAHDEWRDGFEPMMNYAWPVLPAYGLDLEEAVEAMAKVARSCVLIRLSDDLQEQLYGLGSDVPEYVIALTGGGMDLSDHIAAAYLCCGAVPPERILVGLSNVMDAEKASNLQIAGAFEAAAEFYRNRADRLDRELAAIIGKGV